MALAQPRPAGFLRRSDRFALVPFDVLDFVLLPAMHEYSLAALACVTKALSQKAHAEAAKRVARMGYRIDTVALWIVSWRGSPTVRLSANTTKVSAGLLARLERDEERARELARKYQANFCSERLLECASVLRSLYDLDERVLTRPDALPHMLIRDRATRAWTLHLLPILGDSFCERHLDDITPCVNDADAGVRRAALIALRAAIGHLKGSDLDAHADTFARQLGDSCEEARRVALVTLSRFSPAKIAQHQAALWRLVADPAVSDRDRMLARRALTFAGLDLDWVE